MPRVAPRLPRPVLLLVAAAWLVGLVAAPVSAATAVVTGSLSYAETTALSPSAIAVVTVVDTSASADAGVIVGQQRIANPGNVPIAFAVPYDASTIVDDHAYALFASIIDGNTTWQNNEAVPVITGGPTSGVDVVLPQIPTGLPQVTGTMSLPAGTTLSSSAVLIAALIKSDTGTLVSRDVHGVAIGSELEFGIPVDTTLIDFERDLRRQGCGR